LNGLLNKETQGKVDATLTNLQATSNQIAVLFEKKSEDLASSITHAQQILANIDTLTAQNKTHMDSALGNLSKASKEIEVLTHNLNTTNKHLSQILAKINKGQGSLGKLVNDDGLYNNLESLSAGLDSLVKNINEDPGEYLKHMRLIEIF